MKLNASFTVIVNLTTIPDSFLVIARLQKVQIVASEIDGKAKEISSDYDASLDQFSPLFYRLTRDFETEFDRYQLDEVAVAAITPLVYIHRRMTYGLD